jgi:hypothetical protein
MLKIQKQPFNSVWIIADSQEELGKTFMRFQEFYESPNPMFKNRIFTIGMVKHWYSTEYGADTYHTDWTGFNFPSKVLIPFKQGFFDPLTVEEKALLNLFKYRNDDYYIIGAQNKSVLRHELSHALYAYSSEYKNEIDNFINKNRKKLQKTIKYILEKGYAKEVLNDEIQAYVTDNDDADIINNTCPAIISGINAIYKKHNRGKIKNER